MMKTTQKNVVRDNITLWTEAFGDAKNPAVLLVGGSGCQALFWPESFCKVIASHGFFVIRYDLRDTGLSTYFDFNKEPYSLDDLARDAIDILDSYNIKKAHVVGFSMGGYIVQILSIFFSERILSVTSIASSCDNLPMSLALKNESTENCSLPPPTKSFVEMYSHNTNSVEDRVKAAIVLNGGEDNFDEVQYRKYAKRVIERSRPLKTVSNHSRTSSLSIKDRSELLKKVNTLYLIIHGDRDPAFPIAHAKFMDQILPNSTLEMIKDMGHSINPVHHEKFIDLIVKHIKIY